MAYSNIVLKSSSILILLCVLCCTCIQCRVHVPVAPIHPPSRPSVTLCPCATLTNCSPVAAGYRTELFAFQVIANNWKQYDWDALTTVVLFGALDNEMLCHAHANNV